ncbi:DoxX family protein [Albibacterium profundi]|uniref:DoxX family protein n=1 Tax=Albibacterium profundi TaxID=3134906 RepID=A0ABV5CBU7_9SPHI
MNLIQKVEYWGDTHHPQWLDILRIALGIFIFIKGVLFIADTNSVLRLLEDTAFQPNAWAIIHYVAFAHLVGGIFIAFGLLTRIFVVFQLPILIGAVFFVNLTNGLSYLNSELWVSVLVLILLLVFLVVGSGSGTYSTDGLIKRRRSF